MFGFKRKRKPQRAANEQTIQPMTETCSVEVNVRDTILAILTSNVS